MSFGHIDLSMQYVLPQFQPFEQPLKLWKEFNSLPHSIILIAAISTAEGAFYDFDRKSFPLREKGRIINDSYRAVLIVSEERPGRGRLPSLTFFFFSLSPTFLSLLRKTFARFRKFAYIIETFLRDNVFKCVLTCLLLVPLNWHCSPAHVLLSDHALLRQVFFRLVDRPPFLPVKWSVADRTIWERNFKQ